MKYGKPPLSFEKQADRLINRGLAADKAVAGCHVGLAKL